MKSLRDRQTEKGTESCPALVLPITGTEMDSKGGDNNEAFHHGSTDMSSKFGLRIRSHDNHRSPGELGSQPELLSSFELVTV